MNTLFEELVKEYEDILNRLKEMKKNGETQFNNTDIDILIDHYDYVLYKLNSI